MGRTDEASLVIEASAVRVYRALADPDAVAEWLPPDGMTGRILEHTLKPGGGFRMELTYDDASGAPGKTAADTDVVSGTFTDVEAGVRIVREVRFESDDPALDGVMSMTWAITAQGMSTLVVFRAEDVPEGIAEDDHRAGLESSLRQLADYVS
jgi:uncharacterized protein YndB with AHSA1/START domain